jgi:hypothetical protein
MSFPTLARLYPGRSSQVSLAVACPTPNLGSGAHAAGISEAKGAQPSGWMAAPPSGRAQRERESPGRDVTEGGSVTEDKSFKRRVRDRMSQTGESYTAARGHVAQKRDRVKATRTALDWRRHVGEGPFEAGRNPRGGLAAQGHGDRRRRDRLAVRFLDSTHRKLVSGPGRYRPSLIASINCSMLLHAHTIDADRKVALNCKDTRLR